MSDLTSVWARYRDNTARHFIGIGRDLQHRVLHHLSEVLGYSGLRPSLGPLLSLVALESRPLGALAAGLGVSPQACSQLVNVAERGGYLERRPDPTDRRARRVRLTEKGHSLVEEAAGIIREIEADYRRLVGDEAYADLTRLLGELFRGLELPNPTEARSSVSSSQSIGVLPMISVRIQQDLMAATSARGHVGLKMSHAQVLPLIGSDGARIHQLATIQRTSRQAISATARDLETLGVLRREADPLDRRGVVYCLTALGTRLITDSVASLEELDLSFQDVLGKSALGRLQHVARDLYQGLHLEEEIFEARSRPAANPTASKDARTTRGAVHPIEAKKPTDPIDRTASIDLIELADTLKRQLGPQGAERLAHLLDARNQPSDVHSKGRAAAQARR